MLMQISMSMANMGRSRRSYDHDSMVVVCFCCVHPTHQNILEEIERTWHMNENEALLPRLFCSTFTT